MIIALIWETLRLGRSTMCIVAAVLRPLSAVLAPSNAFKKAHAAAGVMQ